jgi:hypothetical protein
MGGLFDFWSSLIIIINILTSILSINIHIIN